MGRVIGTIEDVTCTPLQVIRGDLGNVFHGLKSTDRSFCGFGESYISTVEHGAIKGWKRHREMTLNLVVPVGRIRFVIFDDRLGSQSKGRYFDATLSPEDYQRLTVPPGLWFGFRGESAGLNMLMNVANIPHDAGETEHRVLSDIAFDWDRYD